MIYKDGTKELDWGKIISVPLVLMLLVYGLIHFEKARILREKGRDLNPRYTIGTITETYNNPKGAPTVGYEYFINGHKYFAKNNWPHGFWEFPSIGTRYYVKYEANNKGNAELLLDSLMIDKEIASPDSGWLKIPH